MLRAGDIAACYGTCSDSRIIRWGTASPFAPSGLRLGPSHVAMIADDMRLGLTWFESTSLCSRPCLILERPNRGMQAHLPDERVDDYTSTGGRVVIFRPSRHWEFSAAQADILAQRLRDDVELGTRYDMPGAILSGTRLLKFSRCLRADLESLFCSEVIALHLQFFHRLEVENPAHYNPASLLRRLVRTGVYRPYATLFRGGHSFAPAVTRLKLYDPDRRAAA